MTTGLPKALTDFEDLSDAEQTLLEACRRGLFARIAAERPTARTAENRVRSTLLRFLVLGTDPAFTMHAVGIQLIGAWIEGLFDLEAATATCEMYFEACVFERVDLQRATVRYLAICRSVVNGPVNAHDLQCDGGLLLRHTSVEGPADFARARVQGAVDCSGARFLHRPNALSFDGVRVSDSVLLREGFCAHGAVRFIQARIDGALEACGGRFENTGDVALFCDGAVIGGSVLLTDGFAADGEVRLTNARIGGNLECSGGCFEAPVDALVCDGAAIGGAFIFGGGARCRGTMRLVAAKIGLDLDCCGGSMTGTECALMADGVQVSRSVFLRDGFKAAGSIRLLRATIGETFDTTGATIANPGAIGLFCDGARIRGDLFLRDGFQCSGDVRLVGVTIGGNLSCIDCTIDRVEDVALSCDGASVSGAFFFRAIRGITGAVDLSSMRVGTLCDDAESWDRVTGPLSLDGLTYTRFAGGAPTDGKTRVHWLEKQGLNDVRTAFRPQPWEQLVSVLRTMGHVGEARHVAIAKQVRRRRTGQVPAMTRPFHWLYGALVGYGYQPGRLVVIMACVWLACALVYGLAVHPALVGGTPLLAPAHREPDASCLIALATDRKAACGSPAPDYEGFVPLVYSLDVLMPVVNLGYKATWQPLVSDDQQRPLFWGRMLRLVYWFEIAFGWVAGVLLVGVLGSLIKKE